ncbi:MAG TPA: M15 family metallopeptidase [Candidatus Acidoferrales bacterium]|nr:M15 family metallopeptidase [Candidatus Acidoferrales bacterium]
MRRRDFVKGVAAAVIGAGFAGAGFASKAFARWIEPYALTPDDYSDYIRTYLDKMRHYDEPHKEDIFVDERRYPVFTSCVQRLDRLERTAGGGQFQLLALDEALSTAHDYSRVGEFPKAELDLLENIFYFDATLYGFYDQKHMKNISDRVPVAETVKVPHSGIYLYGGLPHETYQRIKHDIGDRVILTSGVRGVMKQFYLFLRKAYDHAGNLSLASRSLAPPGYSFHGISDFDIGQVGLGDGNFTPRFAITEVYRKLKELDYLNLRYPLDNMLGVRYEPWHIKVNWRA